MTNPKDMTNDEINLELAQRLNPESECIQNDDGWVSIFPIDRDTSGLTRMVTPTSSRTFSVPCVNYCNNIADLWPHVVEHGIGFFHIGDDDWKIRGYKMDRLVHQDELQFEVAAELLLVLREKEKEKDKDKENRYLISK